MTQEERQLLWDTAQNVVLLLQKWEETVGGMQIAVAELCRVGLMTPEAKSVTIARLKLRIALLRKKGQPSDYLNRLVEDLDH